MKTQLPMTILCPHSVVASIHNITAILNGRLVVGDIDCVSSGLRHRKYVKGDTLLLCICRSQYRMTQ